MLPAILSEPAVWRPVVHAASSETAGRTCLRGAGAYCEVHHVADDAAAAISLSTFLHFAIWLSTAIVMLDGYQSQLCGHLRAVCCARHALLAAGWAACYPHSQVLAKGFSATGRTPGKDLQLPQSVSCRTGTVAAVGGRLNAVGFLSVPHRLLCWLQDRWLGAGRHRGAWQSRSAGHGAHCIQAFLMDPKVKLPHSVAAGQARWWPTAVALGRWT